MIYWAFVFDFIISSLLPFNSYFVVVDIEKNNLFSIFIVGIFLDFIYGKFLINLIILLLFFLIFKKMKIKKRYLLVKNIIVYIIYFNIMFFTFNRYFKYYFLLLFIGFIMHFLFLKISKMLLK